MKTPQQVTPPVTKAQKALPKMPRADQVPGLVEAAMPLPGQGSGSLISQVEPEARGLERTGSGHPAAA